MLSLEMLYLTLHTSLSSNSLSVKSLVPSLLINLQTWENKNSHSKKIKTVSVSSVEYKGTFSIDKKMAFNIIKLTTIMFLTICSSLYTYNNRKNPIFQVLKDSFMNKKQKENYHGSPSTDLSICNKKEKVNNN